MPPVRLALLEPATAESIADGEAESSGLTDEFSAVVSSCSSVAIRFCSRVISAVVASLDKLLADADVLALESADVAARVCTDALAGRIDTVAPTPMVNEFCKIWPAVSIALGPTTVSPE